MLNRLYYQSNLAWSNLHHLGLEASVGLGAGVGQYGLQMCDCRLYSSTHKDGASLFLFPKDLA